jgi:diguanylate cyclase (GGDEF)-like protein/PAS domain S-box-containing protein
VLAISCGGLLWLLLRLADLITDANARRSVGAVTLGALLLLTIGAAAGIVVAFRQRARQRHRLRLASRHQAIFEQSQDSIIVADSATGRIVDANPAALAQLGYGAEELCTLAMKTVLRSPAAGAGVVDALLHAREPGRGHELQLVGKSGRGVEVDVSCVPVRTEDGFLVTFLARDLSDRKKAQSLLMANHDRLDKLAHHDQLTGLPNRMFLQAHLPTAIERSRSAGAMLAVLFLDLDRFKHINDSRGHEVGDKLLQEIARRVRSAVRPEDVVVRMGGDEFIVVLERVNGIDQVQATASRINELLGAPVTIDGRPLVATVSIGVSLCPRDGDTMGELLKHSDTAMYHAKDSGKNTFRVFSPQLDRAIKQRVAIEASLRAALKLNQLDVHYQPIIDIHTQKVCGLEALLRWRHPSHGWLSPEKFISVAEETGLIVPIGDMVIRRAVQDLAKWREQSVSAVPVSVNISAVQLERSDLRQTIRSTLDEFGVPPGLLQLELTEGSLFEKRTGAFREDAIEGLRDLGVQIAIDDFGTGYSSLAYLKRWRVDCIKIDRGFVRDLVTDVSDHAIVGAIIAMARNLNIQVVAEGVEGWQQLEMLRGMGCHKAQGYLIARAAPAVEMLRFLRSETFDMLDSGTYRFWGIEDLLPETGTGS